MRNILILLMLGLLLPSYAGQCEEVSGKIINVKIAKHSDLKDTREANKFLTETIKSINKMNRPPKGGVNDEELSALYEVAKKYPASKAALRAKYMIGNAYFLYGSCGESKNATICFEDIIANYPDTFEAKMSQAQLYSMQLREIENQNDRNLILHQLIIALQDALPYAAILDGKEDELSKTFRIRMAGSSGSELVPLLKIDVAQATYETGETEQGKKLYKEIMEEYSNSLYSVKASRRLKAIEFFEKKKGD